MSVSKRARIEYLFRQDDPDKLVYFRIGQQPLLKIHKSVLIENSSVFKDMFAEDVTNDEPLKPIAITDRTHALRVDHAFILFSRCLYEKESAPSLIEHQLTVEDNINRIIFNFVDVYIFADKYHVQWLIDACKKAAPVGLSVAMTRYEMSPTFSKKILFFIQMMGLEDQLMSTFKTVKISIEPSNIVEQFKECHEMGIEELTNQVVDFCCNLKFDPSWPEELSAMVMERLKGHVTPEKLKGVLNATQIARLPK